MAAERADRPRDTATEPAASPRDTATDRGAKPASTDLNGTWRAVPSDETIRRRFAEVDLDESGWDPITVPSHWRSTPAFSDLDGALLYRTHFETAPLDAGRRAWLVFDGLFYQGDVWLDGVYLGDTEGYFNRHTFEVTEDLSISTQHVLGVEATCARQDDRSAKRQITGIFQHWDSMDPDWNPGGIWRDVRIETTGPVRARALRVVCTSADAERAVIACRAELDSDTARTVTLRTAVADLDQEDERPIAEGSNFVEWQVTVPNPALWWPHALGDQPLHELRVEVCVDGEVSHTIGRRTGFRSLTWKQWQLSVNGERLFLKGANLAPTRMALAEATEAELRRDIVLAKSAGLDLVRVHGHVSRPELYRAADEEGMLVWQDFPLQWGYARGIRKQAKRQAGAMVDMLGHRPSIAIWCGHNEPSGEHSGVREAIAQELPTFNKSILDRTVKRAIARSDPSRPVIPHSGVWPHPGSGGTDSHLYFDDERELAGFARAFPRMVRFVSEFGAKAPPAGDDGGEAARQRQAEVVKHAVETLRRLKYRPTGGFCQMMLNDAAPIVTSWSVLDHERVPKPGFEALLRACQPVIVVCEQPPPTVAPGDPLALDVHVVSDLRELVEGAVVEATVTWGDGGGHAWRWGGDIPADSCTRVGTITVVVPDVPGTLLLALSLTSDAASASNLYTTRVSGS